MIEAIRGFVASIDSGSWPDWVAAVGTTAAFVVAAIAYARDVRTRRWAQARLVYVELGELNYHAPGDIVPLLPGGAGVGIGDVEWLPVRRNDGTTQEQRLLEAAGVGTAVVHNGSDEVFSPALIRAFGRGSMDASWDFVIPAGPVPPHSRSVSAFLCSNNLYPNGNYSVFLEVTFRDSAGRWWRRRGAEPVRRARDQERSVRKAKRAERTRARQAKRQERDGE